MAGQLPEFRTRVDRSPAHGIPMSARLIKLSILLSSTFGVTCNGGWQRSPEFERAWAGAARADRKAEAVRSGPRAADLKSDGLGFRSGVIMQVFLSCYFASAQ
ncbi:hypothetical protein CHELA40_12035 [Chelatococcus asaccharovorans]|nr:hypothetical protein CHELA40_12035 [Chelatococcus asaccharovorans]CAH1683577.1 hypothetical protein CHELA17_63569 [Chelatococcus asaccharovorans]